MRSDHDCRGGALNSACRAARTSGVRDANRRRVSSGSRSQANASVDPLSGAVLAESVPDSVPPFRETLVFPVGFLEIRIPPSPFELPAGPSTQSTACHRSNPCESVVGHPSLSLIVLIATTMSASPTTMATAPPQPRHSTLSPHGRRRHCRGRPLSARPRRVPRGSSPCGGFFGSGFDQGSHTVGGRTRCN